MPFLLSQLMEASRWVGALLVLAIHINNVFVNQADIMRASHAAPAYVWWFFTETELGHQAVVGFFVLSGWLVGGGVLEKISAGKPFLREYFIHRFSRIYMVLVPALLLTFAVDSLGKFFFADSGVYDWPMFQGHFSAGLFAASVANLQYIVFPYFGTNGPTWSLACEFWYYVIFPLIFIPFASNYSLVVRLGGFALGAVALASLWAFESWFRLGFVIWLIGASAALAPRAPMRGRWLALAIYAVVVIVFRLVVRGHFVEAYPWVAQVADLLGAILFLNILLAFRDGPHTGFSALRFGFHRNLANFSFSLYAVHLPIVIFCRAAVGHFLGRDWPTQLATRENYTMAVAVMVVVVTVAYGFAQLTEAKTSAARRKLRTLVDKVLPDAGHAGAVGSNISQP